MNLGGDTRRGRSHPWERQTWLASFATDRICMPDEGRLRPKKSLFLPGVMAAERESLLSVGMERCVRARKIRIQYASIHTSSALC